MRITPIRIALAVIVFAAALAAALVVLQSRSVDGAESGARGGEQQAGGPAADAGDVFRVGDTWTVKVRQDAGAITPDGESSIATIPFRFQVTAAPKGANGTWKVLVEQDGAEGPFAAGWRLEYRDEEGAMVLHRVAVGSEPPLEATLASIVLGPQFPYETKYTAAPGDATVDAEKLLERSELPPSALPGDGDGDRPSATPPAEAPKLAAGGAPEGSPAG